MQCDGLDGPAAPDLLISIGDQRVIAHAADGEVLVGREQPAVIRVADNRVSRLHIRLVPTAHGWTVADYESANGLYHQGQRITEREVTGTMTVHMSNPAGIPITLTCLAAPGSDEDRAGLARAGRAVAERRQELGLTYHGLHDAQVIADTVLMSLECGTIWPSDTARAQLEEALGWPTETIAALRAEQDTTETRTAATHNPLIAADAATQLHAIIDSIAALPSGESADFMHQAGRVLHELRKLDVLTINAALEQGRPTPVLTVSAIRRTYTALLHRVAQSPHATLGHRLAEARHRAELSASEAAHACGVDLDVVVGVEAGLPVPESAAGALQYLIDQIDWATAVA